MWHIYSGGALVSCVLCTLLAAATAATCLFALWIFKQLLSFSPTAAYCLTSRERRALCGLARAILAAKGLKKKKNAANICCMQKNNAAKSMYLHMHRLLWLLWGKKRKKRSWSISSLLSKYQENMFTSVKMTMKYAKNKPKKTHGLYSCTQYAKKKHIESALHRQVTHSISYSCGGKLSKHVCFFPNIFHFVSLQVQSRWWSGVPSTTCSASAPRNAFISTSCATAPGTVRTATTRASTVEVGVNTTPPPAPSAALITSRCLRLGLEMHKIIGFSLYYDNSYSYVDY